MKVLAIKAGHDGLCVRDPETMPHDMLIFDMPDGSKGTWFVECDEDGRPLEDLPRVKKDKTIPGAGPAKGSQMKVDRQFPNGQPRD